MFDGIVVARVLDDALANAQGEIEAREGWGAFLEGSNDAERVQVVIEAQAMRVHCFVEGAFARMAEGRMPGVVHQRERFGEVSVESERGSDGARKLRHFNGVGEAAPVVVGVAVGKHLRLAGEAAKRTRMNDAGAVALKRRAVGVRRLVVLPCGERLTRIAANGACSGQRCEAGYHSWLIHACEGLEGACG